MHVFKLTLALVSIFFGSHFIVYFNVYFNVHGMSVDVTKMPEKDVHLRSPSIFIPEQRQTVMRNFHTHLFRVLWRTYHQSPSWTLPEGVLPHRHHFQCYSFFIFWVRIKQKPHLEHFFLEIFEITMSIFLSYRQLPQTHSTSGRKDFWVLSSSDIYYQFNMPALQQVNGQGICKNTHCL